SISNALSSTRWGGFSSFWHVDAIAAGQPMVNEPSAMRTIGSGNVAGGTPASLSDTIAELAGPPFEGEPSAGSGRRNGGASSREGDGCGDIWAASGLVLHASERGPSASSAHRGLASASMRARLFTGRHSIALLLCLRALDVGAHLFLAQAKPLLKGAEV